MTRFWNDNAARVIDAIGVFWFTIIVLGFFVLLGLAWHFWPAWLPRFAWLRRDRPARERRKRKRRLRRGFHLPRWRRRRRSRSSGTPTPSTADVFADDALPDVSGSVLRARADAYAADGRFAEAVRERLRAIVRELVDAAVVPAHPDWTVTELARAAAVVTPALEPALTGASTIFSTIWYGQRPAGSDQDRAMRVHDAAIQGIVAGRVGALR